ncbi:MAG TPA: hypothetical protein VHR86_03795, partial [Armatimonadota bacterium]|nr:hypothetical protein [Armatimonadota bacterium]
MDTEDAFTFLYGREQRSILGGGRGRVRRLRFPVTLFHRVAGMPGIEVATGPVDVVHCQVGFTPLFRYRTLVFTLHDVIPLLSPGGFDPTYLHALRDYLELMSRQASLIITGA